MSRQASEHLLSLPGCLTAGLSVHLFSQERHHLRRHPLRVVDERPVPATLQHYHPCAGERLALDVRRGERRYPLDLDWLLPAGEFAPLRCPACAQTGAPLVAAKTHLGCARCLAPKRPATPPAGGTVPPPRGGAAVDTRLLKLTEDQPW